jgi:probable F420-dependent oxidoreductase
MTRPFRFGLQCYNAASPQEWRDQARHAEALGFGTFSVADHVLGPGPALAAMGHPVQDVAAVPAMAVAIEATSTITIGSRVFCTDYRQPVMFAKELATLAFFAEGRLEIGIGAGWLQGEYEAMGTQWDPAGVRIDRMVETIGLIRAHFAEGELDVHGTYVHATGFEGAPRVPTGLPPIMIGGGAERVLGIAGREADIVSLNFNNSSGKLGAASYGTSTADITAQKIEWIRAGAGARFDDLELEIAAYSTVVTDEREEAVAKMAARLGLEPEEFAQHPHALIGSVEEICDLLVERRETFGISYVTFAARHVDAVAPIVARLAGT